jgi:hypothetical protein
MVAGDAAVVKHAETESIDREPTCFVAGYSGLVAKPATGDIRG